MSRHRRGSLMWLALLLGFTGILAVTPSPSRAQQRPSGPSRFQQADAELNQNYQRLMHSLSPPAKERLRQAERAWLEFVVRSRIAFRAAVQRLGAPSSRCEEIDAEEFFNRAYQLHGLSVPNQTADNEAAAVLAQTQAELDAVYQRCLNSIPAAEGQLLRNAQQAWIAFRDAHRFFGERTILALARRRTTQLNGFYVEAPQTPFQTAPDKVDPAVPDPFERAK